MLQTQPERPLLRYRKPLIVVLTMLLLATQACGGEAGDKEKDPEGRVEVEDFQYVQVPGGARIVMGKVYNRSDEAIKAAQLQVALYDEDNRRIGTMSVVVRHIGPGERKAFRQPVDAAEEVRGARVRSVLVL